MSYDIQVVGVGGQGVLLASMIIGQAAMDDGLEVAMSEVHGMAQRGGSVTTTIRLGEEVWSPLMPRGGADLLLGFEPMETYRSLGFANVSTHIVTNTRPIIPTTVSMGRGSYPEVERILERMGALSDKVIPLDATGLAVECGAAIATNSVLVGAVAPVPGFPLDLESLKRAMARRIPERFLDMNKSAFQAGYDRAQATLTMR
ncbi:MAG: indolepyruvate ferredoxin oxidoreductase subunit beta [Thermoplasmatota archaeon]